MSNNFTPGPWSVGIADWTDAGNARYELRGIKTVSAPDARLIESAPDLLVERDRLKAANAELVEALEDCLTFLERDCLSNNCYPEKRQARAALAKNQGGAK